MNDTQSKKESGNNEQASTSVKLPQFWSQCPEAWFLQAESQFNVKNITRDTTKYEYIISALPQEVILTVWDKIKDTNNQNYTQLKNVLIQRHSISEEKKFEELISNTDLGDRKPSDLYRSMELLTGTSSIIGSDLLKQLWMKKLPKVINVALVASGKTNIQDLTEIADKIWEVSQPENVSSVKKNSNDIVSSEFLKTFSSLSCKYNELQNEVSELKKIVTQKHSSRSRSPECSHCKCRSRSSSINYRGRSNDKFSEKGAYCWYHFKYGKRASKCQAPCNFNTKSDECKKN